MQGPDFKVGKTDVIDSKGNRVVMETTNEVKDGNSIWTIKQEKDFDNDGVMDALTITTKTYKDNKLIEETCTSKIISDYDGDEIYEYFGGTDDRTLYDEKGRIIEEEHNNDWDSYDQDYYYKYKTTNKYDDKDRLVETTTSRKNDYPMGDGVETTQYLYETESGQLVKTNTVVDKNNDGTIDSKTVTRYKMQGNVETVTTEGNVKTVTTEIDKNNDGRVDSVIVEKTEFSDKGDVIRETVTKDFENDGDIDYRKEKINEFYEDGRPKSKKVYEDYLDNGTIDKFEEKKYHEKGYQRVTSEKTPNREKTVEYLDEANLAIVEEKEFQGDEVKKHTKAVYKYEKSSSENYELNWGREYGHLQSEPIISTTIVDNTNANQNQPVENVDESSASEYQFPSYQPYPKQDDKKHPPMMGL